MGIEMNETVWRAQGLRCAARGAAHWGQLRRSWFAAGIVVRMELGRKMKVHVIVAALLMVGSVSGEESDRYTIQTHSVSVTRLTGSDKTVEAEDALFKVDSQLGSVWRLGTNAFRRILVRDLVSQKSFTDWQQKQFLKRLDAIMIPEIDFRQASFSDSIDFMQKQIRELDSTIAAGSDEFLRIRYIKMDTSRIQINFTAQGISALETLNILMDLVRMQYRLEDGEIVITPLSSGGGEVIVRTYEVIPSLRERLHGTTISKVLSGVGFDLAPGTGVTYSPELDIIRAATTYQGHQQLQELLYRTGLARLWPGRFRLLSRAHGGKHLLFLLDEKTGETWIYGATVNPDGGRKESFDLLQTNWNPGIVEVDA